MVYLYKRILFSIKNNEPLDIPIVAQWVRNPTRIHEDVGLIPGLTRLVKGSSIAANCGISPRCSSNLALLWLWCRSAAAAPIQLLAWELPYAMDAALKRKKCELLITSNNVDESQNSYGEWRKSYQKKIYSNERQMSGCWWMKNKGEEGWTSEGKWKAVIATFIFWWWGWFQRCIYMSDLIKLCTLCILYCLSYNLNKAIKTQ